MAMRGKSLEEKESQGLFMKTSEKSEIARREFFKKVEELWQLPKFGNSSEELANAVLDEYHKIYGRMGNAPLLTLKGGKLRPRYLLDRAEVWVMYKPPVWHMGGAQEKWRQSVIRAAQDFATLKEAQNEWMKSKKSENLMEWHGLMQGLNWIPSPTDREKYNLLAPPGFGFIQRLDLETDGPVVSCKTFRSFACMQFQMNEHIFSKGYMCLVHGKVENRIQHIRTYFAEIGGSDTAVLLRDDAENNPFNGTGGGQRSRLAESFFKPLAYYHRKDDGSEYSLVYVNILTGITHQVRITMQSVGHPLVGDDKYLPRDQARLDLKWCPRMFLCEVRSDWFDLCGPYEDEKRRRYTRVSIQNCLPKLLQNILENKLIMTERLDPTADLFGGCQYWALGDEQLMAYYPKEEEYRRKVTRWCTRRGIHLDAIDRLLLLEKQKVDQLLNEYIPPEHDTRRVWVCPVCMALNGPDRTGVTSDSCRGIARGSEIFGAGRDWKCPGMRAMYEDDLKRMMCKGWMNYMLDPTIHFLYWVNKEWLEARRQLLRRPRANWTKAPIEDEGDRFNADVQLILEAKLVIDAKAGGFGIHEEDIPKVEGLEHLKMPLGAPPPDSTIARVRLPGRGTYSQWTYTLTGKKRLEVTETLDLQVKRMSVPVKPNSDKYPASCIVTNDELAKRRKEEEDGRLRERQEREEWEREEAEREEAAAAAAPVEEPLAKKLKIDSSARKARAADTFTEEADLFYVGSKAWEKRESRTRPGEYYFYCAATGESVETLAKPAREAEKEAPRKKAKVVVEEDKGPIWKRFESKSRKGKFYYFNRETGQNQEWPPEVDPPWKCIESTSTRGQFYYFNQETQATWMDPPDSARSGKAPAAKASASRPAATSLAAQERLPAGWQKKESDKFPGKFYYVNVITNQNSWTRPVWEKKESASNPGKFYYTNIDTGATQWLPPTKP